MRISVYLQTGVRECLFLYSLNGVNLSLSLHPSGWVGISVSISLLFSCSAWKMGTDLAIPIHRDTTDCSLSSLHGRSGIYLLSFLVWGPEIFATVWTFSAQGPAFPAGPC